MTWRGRLRRMLPYLVALVGGFMAAFLLVAFFVFPAGVMPQDIAIPNVIGLTYADASTQLERAGFVAQRGDQRFHPAAPEGSVLEQDPAPGATDSPGTRVTLVVSAGQRIVTIPPVIGMSREQALAALESAGFEPGEIAERASNEPRGAVIDSRPRPGDRVAVPSKVALVLSAGPRIVLVPDVIGRSLDDARVLLRQVGLVVGEVSYTNGAIADAAAVIVSQSPAAGFQADARSRVNLTVGSRFP